MATYTDRQKTEAVDLYLKHGAAKAAADTGIPRRTISSWVTRQGLAQAKGEQTETAREALAVKNAATRERIRTTMLDKIENLLGRMDMPHHDYRSAGKELHRVEWDTARSGDVKNYAVSAAVLIDKFRLEMGESTARTEVSIDEAVHVLDDEVARMRERRAK